MTEPEFSTADDARPGSRQWVARLLHTRWQGAWSGLPLRPLTLAGEERPLSHTAGLWQVGEEDGAGSGAGSRREGGSGSLAGSRQEDGSGSAADVREADFPRAHSSEADFGPANSRESSPCRENGPAISPRAEEPQPPTHVLKVQLNPAAARPPAFYPLKEKILAHCREHGVPVLEPVLDSSGSPSVWSDGMVCELLPRSKGVAARVVTPPQARAVIDAGLRLRGALDRLPESTLTDLAPLHLPRLVDEEDWTTALRDAEERLLPMALRRDDDWGRAAAEALDGVVRAGELLRRAGVPGAGETPDQVAVVHGDLHYHHVLLAPESEPPQSGQGGSGSGDSSRSAQAGSGSDVPPQSAQAGSGNGDSPQRAPGGAGSRDSVRGVPPASGSSPRPPSARDSAVLPPSARDSAAPSASGRGAPPPTSPPAPEPTPHVLALLDFDNLHAGNRLLDLAWTAETVGRLAEPVQQADSARYFLASAREHGLLEPGAEDLLMPVLLAHSLPVIVDIAKDILERDILTPVWLGYFELLSADRRLHVHELLTAHRNG